MTLITIKTKTSHMLFMKKFLTWVGKKITAKTWASIIEVKIVTYLVSGMFVQ